MKRFGMTLSETLVAGALVGVALTVAALGITAVRRELKTEQTERVLATLDRAVEAYYSVTAEWPTDARDEAERLASVQEGPDGSAYAVLAQLFRIPASSSVLNDIPAVLRRMNEDGVGWTICDGWGRRLRCMTSRSSVLLDRQAVAANSGKPLFFSAGSDGLFGIHHIAATADNLMIRPSPMPTSQPAPVENHVEP